MASNILQALLLGGYGAQGSLVIGALDYGIVPELLPVAAVAAGAYTRPLLS